ncbi:MAG: AAA family ATPase [Candidatus Undinarchaeales archaeon]
MKILAFAGMPGSGKSLASEYAKEKGIDIIRLGDITDIELNKRGLKTNEKNEKKVRESLRKEGGMAVYAKKTAERAERNGLEKVVFDGVRSYEEYLFLKEKYGEDFKVISILVSPETRYKRLMDRKVRSLTLEECKSRDEAEIQGLNHAGTIVMGEKYIINEGSKKEFEEKIKQTLEKFIKATAQKSL